MYILRKPLWDKCSWDEGEEETFKWESFMEEMVSEANLE